jgi:hypothetical protein
MAWPHDEDENEELKLGDIEFTGKDIATPGVKFDKLAISGRGELLLISLVADTQRVKQIRAILCGGAKAVASASGIKVNRPGQEDYYAHTPGRLTISAEGYQCLTHKLGYGLAHALFMTRSPGFMKVVTSESLWKELKAIRFTTPLLKEWVPYIESELRSQERLEDAHVFNCKCGILTATSAKLDEIVGLGLEQRSLIIPLPVAV